MEGGAHGEWVGIEQEAQPSPEEGLWETLSHPLALKAVQPMHPPLGVPQRAVVGELEKVCASTSAVTSKLAKSKVVTL